jgi:ABC-type molybdate transport system substrate-binding protein
VATQHLVLAVRRGNPKAIRGLADLARADVRLALPNPEAASAGKAIRTVLGKVGLWDQVARQAAVFKPTVNEVANDVILGSIDVGVVWDPLIALHPGMEGISTPELEAQVEQIGIGVLASAVAPTRALHFARYLTAKERGMEVFRRAGYQTGDGDRWDEHPMLTLFSGGVNRVAIEETLHEFERREGCTVSVVYNGCGILVAQMEAVPEGNAFPDAYLACDVSFLDPIAGRFGARTLLSETEVVVLAPRDNPHGIRTLHDLTRPGLRLGLCHPEQSTLGALTATLLRSAGIAEAVQANVRSHTPTADLLVTQLQTGSLDAVVVYRANASAVLAGFIAIPIDLPQARAVQPFAVVKQARHPQLAQRLLQALAGPRSRARYEAAGFRWHEP